MLFKIILTTFAVILIAAGWLPWIRLVDGPYNGFNFIAGKGGYLLVIPLLFALLAIVSIWRDSENSPALIAPLFMGYAASTIILGLIWRAYSIGIAINLASPSLPIAGIGVFPAILYADGMPHPANRLLYHFVNMGKIRFDEVVHHAARSLSLDYEGSAIPIDFPSAEGTYKGRSTGIYGYRGSAIASKIAVVKIGGKLASDDIIIAKPRRQIEAYLKAFGVGMPAWLSEMIGDDWKEPLVERFEVETDGLVVSSEFEIFSPSPDRALDIVKHIRDDTVYLDADLIAITRGYVYAGYDLSLVRVPVTHILDKVTLHLGLVDKVESKLKRPKRGRPSKKATKANLSSTVLN